MSTISVRIPDSLYKLVKDLAGDEKVSINQFINSAVAEKVSAYRTERYLEERARRGDRARFEAVLRQVRDVPPQEGD